jgi:tetratricopeptide (TPR) repeat protein
LWPAAVAVHGLRVGAGVVAFGVAAVATWRFLPWYVVPTAGAAAALAAFWFAVERIPGDVLGILSLRYRLLLDLRRPPPPEEMERLWRDHADIVESFKNKDRKAYERCLRLAVDEGSAIAYERLARVLSAEGRGAELAPVRERVLAGSGPDRLRSIARHLEKAGRPEEALVFLRAALDRGLERGPGLVAAARLLAALGDTDAAMAAYRESAGCAGTVFGPADRPTLAEWLYRAGRLDDAESVLRDHVASGPVTPLPLCLLLVERGRAEEAVELAWEQYERWGRPHLRAALAWLLAELGHVAEAERLVPSRRYAARRPTAGPADTAMPGHGLFWTPLNPLADGRSDDDGGGGGGGGFDGGGGDGGGGFG